LIPESLPQVSSVLLGLYSEHLTPQPLEELDQLPHLQPPTHDLAEIRMALQLHQDASVDQAFQHLEGLDRLPHSLPPTLHLTEIGTASHHRHRHRRRRRRRLLAADVGHLG
jgi:hypothetical protein